jgi:hypothetical protein
VCAIAVLSPPAGERRGGAPYVRGGGAVGRSGGGGSGVCFGLVRVADLQLQRGQCASICSRLGS